MPDHRPSYVIAVTGGRDFTDRDRIRAALAVQASVALESGRQPILLVGGCPTGADEIARQEWHRMQRPYVVDPASWDRTGKGAGFARNSRMAIGASFYMDPPLHPDILLRFPGGNGTADAAGKFGKMGIEVVEA